MRAQPDKFLLTPQRSRSGKLVWWRTGRRVATARGRVEGRERVTASKKRVIRPRDSATSQSLVWGPCEPHVRLPDLSGVGPLFSGLITGGNAISRKLSNLRLSNWAQDNFRVARNLEVRLSVNISAFVSTNVQTN